MYGIEKNGRFLGSVLLVALLALPMIASADKGHFQGHAVLESVNFTQYMAQEGHPMKSAMAGEMDGLIFHNGGGSSLDRMLDKAHYHLVYASDGLGNGKCAKTFTTKDGSKLFASCIGRATPTGSTGTVTILGGTGAFEGIKGKGKFDFFGVTDRVFWDDIGWDWETP